MSVTGFCQDIFMKFSTIFPFFSSRPPNASIATLEPMQIASGEDTTNTRQSRSRRNSFKSDTLKQSRSRQNSFNSDSLTDSPVHLIQASAAKMVRSHSLQKMDRPSVKSALHIVPGDTDDTPVHKIQAAAAAIVRSHSLDNLDIPQRSLTKKYINPVTKSASVHPMTPPPHPCFEFEQATLSDEEEPKEEDLDELANSNTPPPSPKRSIMERAFRFFARPFLTYRRTALVAVKGRVRSSSYTRTTSEDTLNSNLMEGPQKTCPPCQKIGQMHSPDEVSNQELCDCGAFDLRSGENLTCDEAKNIKRQSLKDPACLVGYQILLLAPDDMRVDKMEAKEDANNYSSPDITADDIEKVDELLEPLGERLRVVTAYLKDFDHGTLRRASKYLLMRADGSAEWNELRRGPHKRGKTFTILRRVCE